MAKIQFSIRSLLLIVTAAGILVAVVVELNGRLDDLYANGYRVQAAGDLLVKYLDDCGKWPKNWDDLRQYVEDHKSTLRYVPDMIDLQNHVRIKFDFDLDRVDLQSRWSDSKPPFVVVSSTYGRTSGATRNPNEFIYAYLRGEVVRTSLDPLKKPD